MNSVITRIYKSALVYKGTLTYERLELNNMYFIYTKLTYNQKRILALLVPIKK